MPVKTITMFPKHGEHRRRRIVPGGGWRGAQERGSEFDIEAEGAGEVRVVDDNPTDGGDKESCDRVHADEATEASDERLRFSGRAP
jgi:hypothetical protein